MKNSIDEYDNGGAIARKGFNYQDAVVSLVAIKNYTKPNFKIYVETKDDFEVEYDSDYHAYIQVKGTKKLSLAKLLASTNNNPSIIEKNLSHGDEKSKYKIVVYDFSSKDIEEMTINQNDELFGHSYMFSSDQTNKIGNKKSDSLSLVKTDFNNDSSVSRKMLIGEMQQLNISVDKKGDIILDELARIISQKSEPLIKLNSDIELKKITAQELEPLLLKAAALEMFNKILDKFDISEHKKQKIKNCKNALFLEFSSLKNEIIELLKSFDLDNENEITVIKSIKESEILMDIDEVEKYAICISAYCDTLEGV
ncbi:MAG: DUF4297 domain-containing protein [Candidatus Ancillula sp.]|jgi:transcriptional regulator|nr:DUF4297 domain-containing protein [Candidatus Ancillula sp.]